tara:strand:- start:398 stop:775 length:378 start_codon:yes stop_codon:yes gene_type:complete
MNFNVSYFWNEYYADRTIAKTYSPFDSYLDKFRAEQRDLLKFIPSVNIRKFPLNGNRGLYGWTYRDKSAQVNIREDLTEDFKTEVIVHEAIHTPDEYETRRLTEWIMESMNPTLTRYEREVRYLL